MAQIVTQTVSTTLWPCATRAEMDETAWDLLDNHPTVAGHTFRIPAVPGNTDVQVFLQVITTTKDVVQVNLGETLVYNPVTGWQSMNDGQLAAAGLPVSPAEPAAPSTDTP